MLTLTIIFYPLTQQSKLSTSQTDGVFSFDCLGGYREGETPGPIPNPEAKPLIADNTAGFTCGNVGRCLVRQSNSFLFNHTFKSIQFALYITNIDTLISKYL